MNGVMIRYNVGDEMSLRNMIIGYKDIRQQRLECQKRDADLKREEEIVANQKRDFGIKKYSNAKDSRNSF